MNKQNTIYLSLGTNLGNKKENIDKAIELLKQKINIINTSKTYETKPFGYKDQDNFNNLVLKATTILQPQELLFFTQFIEQQLGRKVTFRNGPRIIDIDILFYSDLVQDSNDLTIPHPNLQERDFILQPLSEIEPDLIHPILNKTIKELEKEVKDRYVIGKILK